MNPQPTWQVVHDIAGGQGLFTCFEKHLQATFLTRLSR